MKASPGCTIPWHWHTPDEHVMILSGAARLQMKEGKPMLLRPGGYALMPAKHVHQFRCAGPCSLFLVMDSAFDIHYVDPSGKEVSPDDALKAVKETPGKAGM